MTKNMTEGNILQLLLRFAIPLLLGNLFQQTYNLIDAAIVGQVLGSNALAGVGASSSVQFLVIGFCMGLCSGFAVPVAQRFGADDFDRLREYVRHSYLLSAVIAAALMIVCALLCPQILRLLSVPDEIFADAYMYLLILFLGIPCTILYNLMGGLLRAVGDSRTPFLFLAVSTCVNIFLDLFCIIVLQLGVAGAAIATITSQAMSGILCFIHIRRKVQVLHVRRGGRGLKPDFIKDLLVMGIPMGLQFSITAIGTMVMQSANNGLGTVYVTGFTAASKIKMFASCPFDALANSVSTFCGQNLGAGKMNRVRRGLRTGTLISVLYGIGIGLVLIFFGRRLSCLFVSADSTEILDASAHYLRMMGYCYWMLGFLNVMRQATQGIGFAGRAIFSGVVEMIARCIVSLAFVPMFGYAAICVTDQSAWASACVYIIPMCLFCVRKLERTENK